MGSSGFAPPRPQPDDEGRRLGAGRRPPPRRLRPGARGRRGGYAARVVLGKKARLREVRVHRRGCGGQVVLSSGVQHRGFITACMSHGRHHRRRRRRHVARVAMPGTQPKRFGNRRLSSAPPPHEAARVRASYGREGAAPGRPHPRTGARHARPPPTWRGRGRPSSAAPPPPSSRFAAAPRPPPRRTTRPSRDDPAAQPRVVRSRRAAAARRAPAATMKDPRLPAARRQDERAVALLERAASACTAGSSGR